MWHLTSFVMILVVSIIRAACSEQGRDYNPVRLSPLLEWLPPMRTMRLNEWSSTGRLLPSITSMLSSWHLGNKISRYNVLSLGANNEALLVRTKWLCSWGGNVGRNAAALLPVLPVCSKEVLTWKKMQSGGEIIGTVRLKESCNQSRQTIPACSSYTFKKPACFS